MPENNNQFITLDHLLEKYERIKLVSLDDNEQLISLYLSTPMQTDLFDLVFDRSPNFFNYTNMQNAKSYIFSFHNQNGDIAGLATLTVSTKLFHGDKTEVLYISDLRTKQSIEIKTAFQWKKIFDELMSNYRSIEEFKNVHLIYSLILNGNQKIRKAIGNTKKDFMLQDLGDYTITNIYWRSSILDFFYRKKLQKLHLENASNNDLYEIKSFLTKQTRHYDFSDFYSSDEFDDLDFRLENWSNFDLSNFILIKYEEEMIGMCSPYSLKDIKTTFISNLHPKINFLLTLLKKFNLSFVNNDGRLQVLYLTHLFIDHSKPIEMQKLVLLKILQHIEQHSDENQLISLMNPSFVNQKLLRSIGAFLETSSGTLTQVVQQNHMQENSTSEQIGNKGFVLELCSI